AREVVEEAPLAQARRLADVVDAGGAQPLRPDDAERGVEEPRPGVRRRGGQRRGRSWPGHAKTIPTGWYGRNDFLCQPLPPPLRLRRRSTAAGANPGVPDPCPRTGTLPTRPPYRGPVPRSLAALTCLAAVTLVATSLAATGRREPRLLEVDHLMLHVSPGAPERAALARAGFTVSPDLN